jgi:hypothetical protein
MTEDHDARAAIAQLAFVVGTLCDRLATQTRDTNERQGFRDIAQSADAIALRHRFNNHEDALAATKLPSNAPLDTSHQT